MIEATLILVNFATEHHVVEVLGQLLADPRECPEEIIIIDNSPERRLGERDEIRRSHARYIPSPKNAGFAGAVNRGLDVADKDIVILLNPDARPEPGCLAGLVALLKSEPNTAVAGPRLIPMEPGTPSVPSATRIDPDLWTSLVEYTVARRFVPRDWLGRNYFASEHAGAEVLDCAMVQGACFALLKEWAVRLGGFDADRFFLYWEETDFCRRVRQYGGRVLYCPRLICKHVGGASLDSGKQHVRHFWQSLYAYHRKHRGMPYTWLLRLLLVGGIAAEYLILWTLRLARGAGDRQLLSDMETLFDRLREQLRISGR